MTVIIHPLFNIRKWWGNVFVILRLFILKTMAQHRSKKKIKKPLVKEWF